LVYENFPEDKFYAVKAYRNGIRIPDMRLRNGCPIGNGGLKINPGMSYHIDS